MTERINRHLSRLGVQTRTAAGFSVLLLLMAGLGLFSRELLARIGEDVRVQAELAVVDRAIGGAYERLQQLNALVSVFMRTRDVNDIAVAHWKCRELTQVAESAFALFDGDPRLLSQREAIRENLDRHAKAIDSAAEASLRHQRAIDRFLAASIPIANTVYAMGTGPRTADPPEVVQAKLRLQASFTSSRAAVTRYVVSLQPADGETALMELSQFEDAVRAQKPTGQERFDRFLTYIGEKLPLYLEEARAIENSAAAQNRAEAEIRQASAKLDTSFDHLKRSFAAQLATTTAAQMGDVATLERLSLHAAWATLVLGLVLAWLVGRSITQPILKLTEAMRRIASGELNVAVPALDHADEIGRMAAATEVFRHNALALRASEARHREVLENLVEGVFQSLPDGRLLSANKALALILGWETPEALVAEVDDLGRFYVIPDQRRQVLAAIWEEGALRDFEATLRRRDGAQIAALLSARGVWEDGRLVRIEGTLVDVTERRRLQEIMIQTEKMMGVGGLAAGMAHEINNPLSGIMQGMQVLKGRTLAELPGNVAAAKAAGCDFGQIRAYMRLRELEPLLDAVSDSAKRAASIVQNMLAFSRKSESGHAPADINRLLDESVSLSSTDYDLKKNYDFRRIAIERDYALDLPPVPCSVTRIEQVFMNILRNAAQAMGGQGDPRITLRTRLEGDRVVVSIGDNGPGMDESVRRRIFEPFYTTKPPGAGTGLGLSVSYFIITDNHSGTIEVESWPGKGTTFTIRLPVSQEPAAPDANAS